MVSSATFSPSSRRLNDVAPAGAGAGAAAAGAGPARPGAARSAVARRSAAAAASFGVVPPAAISSAKISPTRFWKRARVRRGRLRHRRRRRRGRRRRRRLARHGEGAGQVVVVVVVRLHRRRAPRPFHLAVRHGQARVDEAQRGLDAVGVLAGAEVAVRGEAERTEERARVAEAFAEEARRRLEPTELWLVGVRCYLGEELVDVGHCGRGRLQQLLLYIAFVHSRSVESFAAPRVQLKQNQCKYALFVAALLECDSFELCAQDAILLAARRCVFPRKTEYKSS